MANVINFIQTNAADELISKVLSGKTLNFTRMAVGDGFSYDLNVAKGFTTLVNEVLSLDITKKETLSAKSIKITSAFKNTDAQKEFYYREVGLYAQDPDTGEEVLYAYGNRNDAAELMTPTGSNVITKQLAFVISVGDSANVTFNVNADVYALQEDMLDVQADITTLQTDLDELNRTKANQTDLEVERARIDNFTALAQGSTTGDAELIDGRIDDLGNSYTNIGTALRTRISQLSSEIVDLENGVIGEPTYKPFSQVDFIVENDVIYMVSRADGSLVRQESSGSAFCSTIIECSESEKYKLSFRHTSVLDNVIVTDANDTILESYYTRDNTESVTVEDLELIIPNGAKYIYLSSTKTNGFGVKCSKVQKVYEGLSNIKQIIIVDINGGGDFTKITEAINNATENTEIIVKSGVYDIIQELGEAYFNSFSTGFGVLMPKNSKLKFCAGAKLVCNYNGTNNAVKEFFSPINSNRGSVEYEDIVIEASNVKYCIHDEHGGEVEPYTVTFNRCNLYLDDSQNALAYSKSCIGGGLGKYATVEVKNSIFESVGEQIGGTVSYHTSSNINEAICHVNIHNNYFVGDDDTARVYSAYTGNGTQTTFASVNNNSLGKAYMTDDKVVSKCFLNEVRS